MSDLISTPSQTQSAVSNEAFEALIDLLASDGIDENPSPLPGNRAPTQPNMTLRDPSGKLDFDKIRLMFATQNHRVSAVPESLGRDKNRTQSPTAPKEDGDSDDERRSPRTTPSTLPSRTNSMSPRPTQRATTGHRRSSTFGNQPFTVIHENDAAAKVEDAAPTVQPLSFDELNAALAGAHEEVRSLRKQYDDLQALVSKRSGAEKRDQAKISMDNDKVTIASRDDSGRVETRDAGSQAQPIVVVPPAPPPSDLPTEIANLSENEAKRALGALVQALNLSPSAIGSMASVSPRATSKSPLQSLSSTRQHDVASIARTVKFLSTVDELVWRRALAPSGPRTLLPVYSEENIVALLARLELWERAVRRSPRA